MMCVNIFSSFISFYVSFVILCPSSLAIEVSAYDGPYGSKRLSNGTSYKMHFPSGTTSRINCEVYKIKDNVHVTAYKDHIPWAGGIGLSSSYMKYFDDGSGLHLIVLFNIKLKICTKENICISHTIVEGRCDSDATPLSGAETSCKYTSLQCGVAVTVSHVITAYVLERNASSVSTSTASTTTREPVTSVLAATDQPETVAASENWTATIVTVAVTSAAVLLLALITVACICLCRALTPGQPASDRFWNRFYVNNLMRDECNAEIREREQRDAEIRERERRDAEIRERERRDAEIRERERRDAEPEYDYVYDHRYAPRTQRTR